jgi:hypothetical protein
MKTIFSAFIKAQRQFKPALKTSTNPHFRSRYADLSACIDAVIDALNSNGIGLIQQTHECDNGVKVSTVLIHESGEQMSFGILHVPASKNDAQGYGSALSYARRYSLLAACGIAPENEDDDGNAAVKSKSAPKDELPATFDSKPRKSKAATTFYNLESLTGDKKTVAETYLVANSCKRVVNDVWESPITLEKLTQYIVENYEKNT